MGKAEALKLIADVDEVYVSKGTKVVHLDLKKDKPSQADILALIIGPTGNLRAPTFKKGRTLVVGYSDESYAKTLSGRGVSTRG